ncbi:type II secretion system F family protein [Olsenella intestinalis]|uniref:type II secretion system F family protein n=1 Tax=Olsenella intestinalis TaxID=2930083 RepID=UPI00200E5011|nr:type II secretion system F family protein [Olsenella intestinalis]
MAETLLESSAISAFCGSMASMLSAGIQMDEAVHMLSDNQSDSRFRSVCGELYATIVEGSGLADAMAETSAFPEYAVEMVRAGERSGRVEGVLRSLETYYDEEGSAFAKLRAAVSYPAALLCIMAVILAFTVIIILPVFISAYERISGSLTSSSFGAVGASIAIGWVALVVTIVLAIAVLALALMCASESGRLRAISFFENFGPTRDALYELAVARFTSALSTYISSGLDTEAALESSMGLVTNATLHERLEGVLADMRSVQEPLSLAQAIAKHDIFEPVYARMLQVGSTTGSIDQILSRLSHLFFDDALEQVDALISRVEPLLAAFLTLAVGTTLVSVMLPLIGIMHSIA